MDQVILELDGETGNQKARNVYGINLISRTVDSETLFYMYNGHADVTALLDTNGNVVGSYYYDAFGNIENETGDKDNPFRYSGYQFDEETDLYYLNARYYDSKIARFMQEDTFTGYGTDPLSLNLYTYCANNPIRYYDPTGHIYLQKGAQGDNVSEIQRLLGIDATGVFDEATENAVNQFKDKAGLGNTGVWRGAVGDQTIASMREGRTVSFNEMDDRGYDTNRDDSIYINTHKDSDGTLNKNKSTTITLEDKKSGVNILADYEHGLGGYVEYERICGMDNLMDTSNNYPDNYSNNYNYGNEYNTIFNTIDNKIENIAMNLEDIVKELNTLYPGKNLLEAGTYKIPVANAYGVVEFYLEIKVGQSQALKSKLNLVVYQDDNVKVNEFINVSASLKNLNFSSSIGMSIETDAYVLSATYTGKLDLSNIKSNTIGKHYNKISLSNKPKPEDNIPKISLSIIQETDPLRFAECVGGAVLLSELSPAIPYLGGLMSTVNQSGEILQGF